MKQQYAVIGLGRFGGRVVEILSKSGHEVLAVDKSALRVAHFSDIATQAVEADTTSEIVMRDLGIQNMHTVVVGIGDDIQANILTCMICLDLNVPFVIAKAANTTHGNILKKMGVHKVVYPERDSGTRVAHNLVSQNVLDYLELEDSLGIVELVAPDSFIGKSLEELDCRKHYNATVISIKRNKKIIAVPEDMEIVHSGDVLIIIGSNDALKKLENSITS